eukprot:6183118-Lingulodinium_polyedra.AAC.1
MCCCGCRILACNKLPYNLCVGLETPRPGKRSALGAWTTMLVSRAGCRDVDGTVAHPPRTRTT